MKLDYDIVVVTANRPDILRISLPTMIGQTRPAKSLIVADASDDHEAVVRVVREATAGASFPVEVFRAAKGLTRQRNAAVAHTSSAVIFFPDDDSVWCDDVAEHVMAIYDRDTEQRIGGVGQAETFESPIERSSESERARQGSLLKTIKYRLGAVRHGIVNGLTNNPLHACGLDLLARYTPPSWLAEMNAVPIERLIGFRMTFRADAVRRHRFDENLHQPRCLWEDFAISYEVLQDQMLVEAKNAKVFHHRFEGARGNGLTTGVEQFLNICYLVCKYSPPGSHARRAIYPYARIFFAEALLRSPRSAYERDKVRGMRRAQREFESLVESPADQLTPRYHDAIARCLQENPQK